MLNERGRSPAYVASMYNHVASLRALAKLGADLDTTSRNGSSPVLTAARLCRVGVIRALSELGADLNVADVDGHTALHVTAYEGKIRSIMALAEGGADVNAYAKEGGTPLCTAARSNKVPSIKALVGLGADINARDGYGKTVTCIAARKDNFVAIRALVKLRADIELVDEKGRSPLAIALEYGHRTSAVFLVMLGADIYNCAHRKTALGSQNFIRDVVCQFCLRSPPEIRTDIIAICALFSLTNLMSCATLDLASVTKIHFIKTLRGEGASDQFAETNISVMLHQLLSSSIIVRMHNICYVLKRRLVLIAWRVYQSTLQLDGDRLSELAKARRYGELVSFLFDLAMLGDVVSLRLTCKSNNERRRFPVFLQAAYHELEGNLIEEWVGYASSRFVSTDIIHTVMAIHESYS